MLFSLTGLVFGSDLNKTQNWVYHLSVLSCDTNLRQTGLYPLGTLYLAAPFSSPLAGCQRPEVLFSSVIKSFLAALAEKVRLTQAQKRTKIRPIANAYCTTWLINICQLFLPSPGMMNYCFKIGIFWQPT